MPEFSPVLKLSSLNGANGFLLFGAAASDRTGYCVHSAGDVNGDGFADVIISASGADPHGPNSGSSYVVFGKAGGFTPLVALSALNGTNGFRLDGAVAGDNSGLAVSAAGDVNGDGFDDVIVGAVGVNYSSGAAYVVFGKTSGFAPAVDLSALNGTNGFRLDSAAVGDNTGFAVSTAGDVNGDGFDDLIIGAPAASPGLSAAGSSFVVFGQAGGFSPAMSLSALNGINGFRLNGGSPNYGFGHAVSSAGDVNGDGFDDLIVGAHRADLNGGYSGSSFVVFGQAGGFAAALSVAGLNGVNGFRMDGVSAYNVLGQSVSSAGDINGDGFDDLIVGAPYAGRDYGTVLGSAYVVFGRAAFGAQVRLAELNGSNGFRIDGLRNGDHTAWSVSDAGDVNGDGFADVLVSATQFDLPGALNAGAAFVVFGRAGGFAPVIDVGALNGNDGFRIDGVASFDDTGISVSAAGDVNGDGFDDLLVGADGADAGVEYSGAAYVVFGHRAQSAVDRVGTDFDNRINGGTGDDTIAGLSGNDTLIGWEGDDTINGGDGNDTLDGGADSDHLSGGSGADTFFASLGDDVIVGGSGSDMINFQRITGGGVTVNLATGAATLPDAESSLVFTSIERLSGTAAADTFTGDARNNQLFGRDGNDVLSGGAGVDRLAGGLGFDRLTGGTGADTFEYDAIGESTANAQRDRIMDFVSADGDRIDLLTIDANTTTGGNQAFAFIGTAAYSGAGQLRYTVANGSAILRGDVNGDGADDFQILVSGVTALAATDFVL